MNRPVSVVMWLRGRADAFANDVNYLERQPAPHADDPQAAWRESRARISAYKIITAELRNLAAELEYDL